jgi:hypothetical protein
MKPLKYLVVYPEPLLARVRDLIEGDRLGALLADKYPHRHAIRNDGQLYECVQALKAKHLRQSQPLAKPVYDGKLQVVQHALGTHTAVSRQHGGQLKARPRSRAKIKDTRSRTRTVLTV